MTPFPPTDELQFVFQNDPWLTQIAINATTLRLLFANDVVIDVGLGLVYRTAEGELITYDMEWFREKPIAFNVLLDKRLVAISTAGFDAELVFEGGGALLLRSDNGPSEAGAVLGPNNAGFYF